MWPCRIYYKGKSFKTLEHAYQWAKAMALDDPSTANYIMLAQHGGKAKGIADKRLPRQQAEQWSRSSDALSVMKELLDIKAHTDPDFFVTLHRTGSSKLVEATSNKYWACGITDPNIAEFT